VARARRHAAAGQPPQDQSIHGAAGYYGEHIVINETEITKRRQVGTFGTPIDITEPQVRAQKQLLIRRNTLIQKLLSDLCCIGLYQVAAADGTIVKAAGFAVRTFTATFPWSTFATSTPLADFTAISFFGRGVSADFGARAVAIMNRTTFANLRQNTNQSDLAGRRQGGFGGINNLTDINTLFTGDGLPMIVLYDGVWFDDARVMHLFIPDNTVVILAPRDTGTRIGAYRMTRNAVNPGAAPGAYARVVDRGAMGQIPPTVEVHDGHNGGPILEFGSSIAVMHV